MLDRTNLNDCQSEHIDEPMIDESSPIYRAGRLLHSIRGDVVELWKLAQAAEVKASLIQDVEDVATAEYYLHDLWKLVRGAAR